MHPLSGNTSLALLSIVSIPNSLGVKRLVVNRSHEVFGMSKSLTSSEYQTSVMLQKVFDRKVVIQAFLYQGEKYARIKDEIFKIEKTYLTGQYIELFLESSDITLEDLEYEK